MGNATRKKSQLEALKGMSAVNQRITQAYKLGQRDGIERTLVLFCWVMHKDFAYGNQRLTKIAKQFDYLLDCVGDGKLSVEDMRQALQNECGFAVRNDG